MIQFFLDVDGVVLDFDSDFLKIINRAFNKNLPPNFCPNDWYWTSHPVDISIEQSLHAYSLFKEKRGFRFLKPYPESIKFIENIKQQGHHIDFVTNIPADHRDDRIFCFKQHHVVYDRVFTVETKSQCINNIKLPDATRYIFIDDNQDNCEDVLQNCPGIEVYILSKPYNLSYTKVARLDQLAALKY
ncbi:MAG: hypothetical protein M1561_02870 [Gammaproteobacteria bacterium]|nr:hypothetical protein [Gammaproteobacteria bacterium]